MRKETFRPSPTALLNPRCDASFKAMFTLDTEESNAALKDFISTILDRPVETVQLMPNEPAVDVLDESQMSFDVSVKFNDGEMVDIEMQSRLQNYDYAARAEIQVARLLASMNKKGDNWNTSAAFQISVLNFEFDKDDDSALSWYSMRRKDGEKLSGRLNVVFFDLVKVHALLGKPVEELSKLEKWGLFLSYADDERYSQYIDGLIKSEEGIMNAKSSLCTVSQDEINWVRQNSIFIAQRDRNTIMQNAVKQGLEQGLRQKAVEVAKKMLSMNICDAEKIAEATGLSVAEVESIAEQG